MAAFDNGKQKMVTMAGVRMEQGAGVTIDGVPTTANLSKQTFTIATKLKKVLAGFGVMDTDGMAALATTGAPSNGQVTFTRFAPIETSADTVSYILFGY
jgi:hypothetical protein